MVQPVEPDRMGSARPAQQARTDLRHRTRVRADELAAQLLDLDAKWHARVAQLKARDTQQYHIDNDPLLRNLSGATKVVSDMLAAMAAYLLATRPPRLPGSKT